MIGGEIKIANCHRKQKGTDIGKRNSVRRLSSSLYHIPGSINLLTG